MHHRFDKYRIDQESPDLIGNLPELRHLRMLEMSLRPPTRWRDDPFLSPAFERVVQEQFDDVSHTPLVEDWVQKWATRAQWGDGTSVFPKAFLAHLNHGGVVIAVGTWLIFDYEGLNGGTCVRVIAPHFTNILLNLAM